MQLLQGESGREEKIGGMVYDMSPSPHYRHGIVNGNIYSLIKNGLKDSLCLVFMENLDLCYHPQENDDYVVPDIMVICDRNHLKGGSYTGVPRFVAETLSPSTAMRDMIVKKEIYEQLGVEEYWIVSAKEQAVQVYYLEQDRYQLRYSYILEQDKASRYYNADTKIALRACPNVNMTLGDIFQGAE